MWHCDRFNASLFWYHRSQCEQYIWFRHEEHDPLKDVCIVVGGKNGWTHWNTFLAMTFATHTRIGHPWMKSTGTQCSKCYTVQWLNSMTGYQHSSPNNGCQATCLSDPILKPNTEAPSSHKLNSLVITIEVMICDCLAICASVGANLAVIVSVAWLTFAYSINPSVK